MRSFTNENDRFKGAIITLDKGMLVSHLQQESERLLTLKLITPGMEYHLTNSMSGYSIHLYASNLTKPHSSLRKSPFHLWFVMSAPHGMIPWIISMLGSLFSSCQLIHCSSGNLPSRLPWGPISNSIRSGIKRHQSNTAAWHRNPWMTKYEERITLTPRSLSTNLKVNTAVNAKVSPHGRKSKWLETGVHMGGIFHIIRTNETAKANPNDYNDVKSWIRTEQ